MPGVIGWLLSIILAAVASDELYGSGLTDIYPALKGGDDGHGHITAAITQQQQALNQLYAGLVTFGIAIAGGLFTGFILKIIGKFQSLRDTRKPGSTVIKLALNVGNIFTEHVRQ